MCIELQCEIVAKIMLTIGNITKIFSIQFNPSKFPLFAILRVHKNIHEFVTVVGIILGVGSANVTLQCNVVSHWLRPYTKRKITALGLLFWQGFNRTRLPRLFIFYSLWSKPYMAKICKTFFRIWVHCIVVSNPNMLLIAHPPTILMQTDISFDLGKESLHMSNSEEEFSWDCKFLDCISMVIDLLCNFPKN